MKKLFLFLLMACLVGGFASNANAQSINGAKSSKTNTQKRPAAAKIEDNLNAFISYVKKYEHNVKVEAKIEQLERVLEGMTSKMSQEQYRLFDDYRGMFLKLKSSYHPVQPHKKTAKDSNDNKGKQNK